MKILKVIWFDLLVASLALVTGLVSLLSYDDAVWTGIMLLVCISQIHSAEIKLLRKEMEELRNG